MSSRGRDDLPWAFARGGSACVCCAPGAACAAGVGAAATVGSAAAVDGASAADIGAERGAQRSAGWFSGGGQFE